MVMRPSEVRLHSIPVLTRLGFVVFSSDILVPEGSGRFSLSSSAPEVVAYSIGDYVAPKEFEIVTGPNQLEPSPSSQLIPSPLHLTLLAWSHPRYRGMGVALHLYLDTFAYVAREGVLVLISDVLEGFFERIVFASPFWKKVYELGTPSPLPLSPHLNFNQV